MKKTNISKTISIALASILTVSALNFTVFAESDIEETETHISDEPDVTTAPVEETTVPAITTVLSGFYQTEDTTTPGPGFRMPDDFELVGNYNLELTLVLPDGVDEMNCYIIGTGMADLKIEHTFTRSDNKLLLENLKYTFSSHDSCFNEYTYFITSADDYGTNMPAMYAHYNFAMNSTEKTLDGFRIDHFINGTTLSQTVMPVKNENVRETSYETTAPWETTTAPFTTDDTYTELTPGNNITVRYGTILEVYSDKLLIQMDDISSPVAVFIPEHLIGADEYEPDQRIQIRYAPNNDIYHPLALSLNIPEEFETAPETTTTTIAASDTDITYNTTAPVPPYETTLPAAETTVPVTTTTFNMTTTANIENDIFVKGDANNDGLVDIKDIAVVSQYIIKLKEITEQALTSADVNNDGAVDIKDLTMIKLFLIGDKKSL